MASWIDRVKTEFTITTGDGAVYRPLWVNAKKSKRYKIAQFEFQGITGSLVKKGEPYASVYEIEILFQGISHLDEADAFYNSADDKKHWEVSHPFYGNLYVQCAGIDQDNSALNVSRITATIVETILDNGLQPKLDYQTIVMSQTKAVNAKLNESFVSYGPKVNDLQKLIDHLNGIYAKVLAKTANVQADVSAYQNLHNNAVAVITTAISIPGYLSVSVMGQATSMVMAPAVFVDTVANRLAMYSITLDLLNNDVDTILNTYGSNTRLLKKLYENNAGTVIAGMCLAAVSNITSDYNYMPSILSIIGTLISAYNNYLANIIALQTLNGGQLDSYIPDAGSITAIQTMLFFTVSSLYTISAGALQQRTYTLPYDDNLINVAYKLYGADPDDSKKATLVANNNIEIDEVLTLKAGRQIIYYA